MKERGLLLSKDLRDKSRSGEKTQTRRLAKLCEKDYSTWGDEAIAAVIRHHAPYQVGDHLYLQEPYQILRGHIANAISNGKHGFIGTYLDDDSLLDGVVTGPEMNKWLGRKCPHMKTSSRFMYKSLARTWFEVTDVSVERLHDIDPYNDIKAEGVDNGKSNPAMGTRHANMQRRAFANLWDSTSKVKWADNPWVWVYGYKRINKSV